MLHGSTNRGHPQITKKAPWERDVRTADDTRGGHCRGGGRHRRRRRRRSVCGWRRGKERDRRAPHTRRRDRVGGDIPGGGGDRGAAGAPCVAGSPARAFRAGGARSAASRVGRRRGR